MELTKVIPSGSIEKIQVCRKTNENYKQPKFRREDYL